MFTFTAHYVLTLIIPVIVITISTPALHCLCLPVRGKLIPRHPLTHSHSCLHESNEPLWYFYRYHTLTVPEEEAANCLLINGSLLVPHVSEIPLSSEVQWYFCLKFNSFSNIFLVQVFKQRIHYPIKEIALSEFQKTGRGLSSLCILIRKSKNIKKLWLLSS